MVAFSEHDIRDRLNGIDRWLNELQAKTARIPIREAEPPRQPNIIYAAVNKIDNVSTGDATFPFNNAVKIRGNAPRSGTGTAQNELAQSFSHGQKVTLHEGDDGKWYTDNSGNGGTTGSQVIYFELIENKTYSDTVRYALPVGTDGLIIGDPEDDEDPNLITVIDEENQFFGKIADDFQTGARGYAHKILDEYGDSGTPGYRIITMEGPAHLMTVVVHGSYSLAGTPCTPTTDQIWGRPFRGRRWPWPYDADITVFDDLDRASASVNADLWLIAWDEAEDHYIFLAPLRNYITVKGTSPGVTRADADFEIDDASVVNGDVPSGTITVTNDPPLDSPSGRTIYASYNVSRGSTLLTRWDTGDMRNFVGALRGLADWYAGDQQVIDHDGDADPHWAQTGDCSE